MVKGQTYLLRYNDDRTDHLDGEQSYDRMAKGQTDKSEARGGMLIGPSISERPL